MKSKGFLRSYTPYKPPPDLIPRFISTCSKVLDADINEDDLSSHQLDSIQKKFKVLQALGEEFSHNVHSSRLHEMTNLDNVFSFYTSCVSSLNPYESLHQDFCAGLLPPNLVVQLDPVRFTGAGDHPMNTVNAYPRTNQYETNIYAKEKYPPRKHEHSPYEE